MRRCCPCNGSCNSHHLSSCGNHLPEVPLLLKKGSLSFNLNRASSISAVSEIRLCEWHYKHHKEVFISLRRRDSVCPSAHSRNWSERLAFVLLKALGFTMLSAPVAPGLLVWPPVAGCPGLVPVDGERCRYRLPGLQLSARGRRRRAQWALRGGVSDLAPFPLGAPKSGCISVHNFFGPPRLGGKSALSARSPRYSYKFRYPPASPKIRREFFPPLLSVHFRRPHPPSTPSKQPAQSPDPPDSTHRQPLHFSSCALIRQAGTHSVTAGPSFLFPLKTRIRTQALT